MTLILCVTIGQKLRGAYEKIALLTIISLMFVHSTIVSAETWDTTWGPVTVRVDNSNRFIGFFNNKEDGIIVMSPNGSYYEGWWARTGNCNCPKAAKTRSGYATSCYGSISGYLKTDYEFRGDWADCRKSQGGPWNGSMR